MVSTACFFAVLERNQTIHASYQIVKNSCFHTLVIKTRVKIGGKGCSNKDKIFYVRRKEPPVVLMGLCAVLLHVMDVQSNML